SSSQTLCRETIVWKQLHHHNILPFIGVDDITFPDKHSLISPCMDNGNVVRYLKKHPDHNRLTCIREIAAAIEFIHSFDPRVVHGDIRGSNIIVNDAGQCCLADFGASIIVATNLPSNNTMGHNTQWWLCPELQEYDPTKYCQEFLPGRDIYALGCTIIEIYTLQVPFFHVPRNAV
ncbi:kinase-like protein, partial [Armillaria solidipes]